MVHSGDIAGNAPADERGIMRNRTLNDLMEFDHVIVVHEDGSITDAPRDIYAPESMFDEDIHPDPVAFPAFVNPDGWEFLSGYSGQDRYAGPIMHRSEYIGGGLETAIRETPGTYVAVVVNSYPDDDDENGEIDADGWAVLRRTGA